MHILFISITRLAVLCSMLLFSFFLNLAQLIHQGFRTCLRPCREYQPNFDRVSPGSDVWRKSNPAPRLSRTFDLQATTCSLCFYCSNYTLPVQEENLNKQLINAKSLARFDWSPHFLRWYKIPWLLMTKLFFLRDRRKYRLLRSKVKRFLRNEQLAGSFLGSY